MSQLVIDIGNTRVKAAVYKEGMVLECFAVEKEDFLDSLKKKISHHQISKTILSSVGVLTPETKADLSCSFPFLELSANTKVPFKNLYQTPKTLGVDRIALVSAAATKYPEKNVLVIDAGTCITYDFKNSKNEFLGGAISPGIELRYKSLHKFTNNLPLLKATHISSFTGGDTNTSIHSGVVYGVVHEIDGVIEQYKKKYTNLTVVLTGGDTYFLSKRLKNTIFANPNFVLDGLDAILTFNIQE